MDTDITRPNRQSFASGPVSGPSDSNDSTPPPTPETFTPPPSDSPSFAPTPKPKKKSSPVLIILLVILALCGIGFGIYGMFLQPPKEKIITITEECETPISPTEVEGIKVFQLYLGELGIKVNTPEDYKGKISYLYREDGTVLIWGHKDETAPDYVNPLKDGSYPLFALSPKAEAFSDEKYSYLEGEKIFTNTAGETYYLHTTDFTNSPSKTELENLSNNLKLFFIDTYQYSNL